MKKEDLKVGMSFEVVELISNIGSIQLKGNQGIVVHKSMYTEVVCNNSWYTTAYYFESKVALMLKDETKPIGKLTITSLK